MRYRLYIGLILLLLMGCSSSATAPSDSTVSVPADATVSLSNAASTPVCYQDMLVTVKGIDSKPQNGIDVKLYEHGSFGAFFSNNSLSTILGSPYTATTDSSGNILVNYCSAPYTCSAAADLTATFGFRAQTGNVSSSRTTTVTIKKCGT